MSWLVKKHITMRSYRSILASLLAVVMVFLVSCGSPTAKAPATYTAEQMAQIQKFTSQVVELRDKMPVLATQIQNRNWTDVATYIHGPLGELRQKMSYVARELLPQEQKAAREATKDLFNRLQNIDTAADAADYQKAAENYRAALKDFDAFLRLIPGQNAPA